MRTPRLHSISTAIATHLGRTVSRPTVMSYKSIWFCYKLCLEDVGVHADVDEALDSDQIKQELSETYHIVNRDRSRLSSRCLDAICAAMDSCNGLSAQKSNEHKTPAVENSRSNVLVSAFVFDQDQRLCEQ